MNIDKFRNYVNSIVSLSNEEWLNFFDFTEIKTYKKNSFLLEEGCICDSIGYVNSGMLIYFKTFENGKEITTDFAFEGEWVTDNQSRLNNSPSFINIKTIEDSELLIIKNESLTEIYNRIPKLEKFGRILMEQAYIKIAQHSINLQVLSAKEHYIHLNLKYPEVFQKIPLHHIANYLGVAPKSLSRIRNEIYVKK